MEIDIIVVGGGHAGIEAANSACKKRLTVLLVTNNLDMIGQMSCNPSIGGIAKGTIVREIDALGGLMGKLIDRTGIHFRMLNTSKGAAVWGNRAQADKVRYRILSRKMLEQQKTLFFLQGMVTRVIVQGGTVTGVEMDSGEKIKAKCVVLAMGTFLNGVIHIGLSSFPAGRSGEPPSLFLAENLSEYGMASGRLKTGTSPRIDGRTVDFSSMTTQPGDDKPWSFSYSTIEPVENKVVCNIGKSTPKTHQIIKDNLDRSPLYSGKIKSIGPRYCPSIEDKVVKFGDRDGHTLFLEPESLDNTEMYLNGLSTSLPIDVQRAMVQSVKGLENARITRPGYGIEYTFFQPNQLKVTLESKVINNLYLAGQINGTSGYEEAACQGLVAGINAAQRILGEEELVLPRHTSYTGVLIDDLVTRGTDEPYRMFTSRAEHRLSLRQDNCDERLSPLAYRLGFLDQEYYNNRCRVWEKRKEATDQLMKTKIDPDAVEKISGVKSDRPVRATELLKRPNVSIQQIIHHTGICFLNEREQQLSIEADIKYHGFVVNQEIDVNRMKAILSTTIPKEFNYDSVKGLLNESRSKLNQQQPTTLGHASRISGITPADISILALHLIKNGKAKSVSRETTPVKPE